MAAKSSLSAESHEDMISIDIFALIAFNLFLSQQLELLFYYSFIAFMEKAMNAI